MRQNKICFGTAHSSIEIPVLLPANSSTQFSIFCLWQQLLPCCHRLENRKNTELALVPNLIEQTCARLC